MAYIKRGLADFNTVQGRERKATRRSINPRVASVLNSMRRPGIRGLGGDSGRPGPGAPFQPPPLIMNRPNFGSGGGGGGATLPPRGFGPMHNPAPVSPLQGHFVGGGDNPQWQDPYDTDGGMGEAAGGYPGMPRSPMQSSGFSPFGGQMPPEIMEQILRLLRGRMGGGGGVPGAY